MKISNTKSLVISSLFWKFLERTGTQGIQILIQIILARVLVPKDFGTIAIVMVFINLANVFVQKGFNTALIQKKNTDNEDYSSVLYLNLFVSACIYLIIYITAPYIATFYRTLNLTSIFRVISLTLFFGAFNSVQNAYVAKNMMFKKLFYSSVVANLLSGTIGIIMAYGGLGVWALVFQQLLSQALITLIMWFTVKWRPSLVFSSLKIKEMYTFGWKLLSSSLLDTLYLEIRTLIIGRFYSPAILGYYTRGQQFPKVIVSNIDGSIQSVMLPALSANQDNTIKLKIMMRRSIILSSFFIFPLMTILAVIADPLTRILLTEKWIESVPYLQIFCISFSFMPIHTANLQAINAMGRSDIFLKLEIYKKILGIIVLVISLPFGVYAIAFGQVLSGILSTFINAYPNKRLLDYSYREQWSDILPSILISIVMGMIIYQIGYFDFLAWQLIMMQGSLGIIIYLVSSKLFKCESLEYFTLTFKQLLKNRKGLSS